MNVLTMAAIADGMNRHNRMVKESTKAGIVTLTDYNGNVYRLDVWVKQDLSLAYLLSCRRIPNALENIFRAALPTRADAFDDPADMLDAIAKTRNTAETVTVELSPESRAWQTELEEG